MESLLALPKILEMSKTEKSEINRLIENSIAVYKNNTVIIYKLTFDAITILTAGESRLKALEHQGFLQKYWGTLAGKNVDLNEPFDTEIKRIQYTSQKLIHLLAEKKLFTFDLVTAINNKLDTMVLEIDEEINKVYQMLGAFFKQTRSDIIQLEARLDKIDRNVELLHWNATIEYQMYNGTEYTMLEEKEKIVCIANDFFHRTKGIWTTADLMVLKSTFGELGLQTKQLISHASLYSSLIEKPELTDRLFEGISADGLMMIEPFEAPLIKGVEKARRIHTDEKYILETVKAQLDIAKVVYSEREVQLSLIQQFLKNMAYSNPERMVNLFDFILEMLVNLKLVDESSGKSKVLTEPHPEGCDVVLFSYGEDKYKFIEGLKSILSINLGEAKNLAARLPATLLSRVSKEEAEEAAAQLSSLGARVRVKTAIETYHEVTAPLSGKIYLTDENPYQLLSLMNDGSNRFVKVGDSVAEDTVTGIVYKNAMMFGLEDPFVRAGVKGDVLEILVNHKQEVKKGDLLMIVRVEE